MSSSRTANVLQSLANWLSRVSHGVPSLNIGIYGYVQAGKTLFLFNLLRYLKQQNELVEANEKCQQFLDFVEREIKQGAKPGRTIVSWEGISFVWEVSYSPKEKRQFRVQTHDLPGEELDNQARGGFPPASHLTRMIQQCDAFLFFFNPTQKQDRRSNDDHVTLEVERAESLLKSLLKGPGLLLRKGPGMRPVIFVITAKDVWESDPELRRIAHSFWQRIPELVKEKWPQAPDRLIHATKIVREVANPPCTGPIPTEQGRQLTAVVRDLFDLHNFARQLRLSPLAVLVVLVVPLILGGVLWLIVSTLKAKDPQIESLLDKLQPWAENWQFPTAQKKQSDLGNLLREACVLALRPNQRAEKIRKRLEEIGGHLIRAMDGEVDDEKFDALDRILAPPRPSASLKQLLQAQRLFWEKFRNRIVSNLKKATNRDAALKQLKEAEARLERYQVPGNNRLVAELNQAISFLDSPKDYYSYEVVFVPTLTYRGQDEQWRKFGHGLRFMERNYTWWLEPNKKGEFHREPNAPAVSETFKFDETISISIYAWNYIKNKPPRWEHVNTWNQQQLENKLPKSSLSYLGAPFLGCEGHEISLESGGGEYVLILRINETKFSGVIPHILKRTAD